jgi:ABC-type phosphate transport system auxiliary subunit
MTTPVAVLGLERVEDGTRGPCSGQATSGESSFGAELTRVEMMDDLSERINALISGSTGDLAQIENTLTDGYARALALEAERWRLEKRVSEVTQSLPLGDLEQMVVELGALTKRLDENADELVKLRAQLADLRRCAENVRIANV